MSVHAKHTTRSVTLCDYTDHSLSSYWSGDQNTGLWLVQTVRYSGPKPQRWLLLTTGALTGIPVILGPQRHLIMTFNTQKKYFSGSQFVTVQQFTSNTIQEYQLEKCRSFWEYLLSILPLKSFQKVNIYLSFPQNRNSESLLFDFLTIHFLQMYSMIISSLCLPLRMWWSEVKWQEIVFCSIHSVQGGPADFWRIRMSQMNSSYRYLDVKKFSLSPEHLKTSTINLLIHSSFQYKNTLGRD